MAVESISKMASRGGKARAQSLTKEERSQIARNAVQVRWEKAGRPRKKLPTVTHPGTLEFGEIKIPCAVLDDGSRVLSQRGVTQAFSGAKTVSGSHYERQNRVRQDGVGDALLPPFLSSDNLKPFISLELAATLANPKEYLPEHGGRSAYGLDAGLIPKVCEVWLAARNANALRPGQQHIATKAEIIIRGLAQVGIIALIDEATGFQDDRDRRALARILEAFIAKELRRWVQTFPVDYYKELYRLRDMPYPPAGNKMPRYFGVLTNDIVYGRLAPGVLDELKRVTPRTDAGRRKHHYHRRLTEDVGHPKLLQHLGAVVAVMKVSKDYDGFIKLLNKHYPPQTDLPLLDRVEEPTSAS